MLTRREFIKVGAMASAGFVLSQWAIERVFASVQIPQIPLAGKAIAKYIDALPTFVGVRVPGTAPVMVAMNEFQQKVLPAASYAALPAPFNAGTYVWGYQVGLRPQLYPGFTIEAQRNIPTTVTYVNNLGTNTAFPVLQQYLSVDQTIHWADPLNSGMSMTPYAGPHPAVVHLHGGEVPSAFDGGPDSWWTPGKAHMGPGFVSDVYTYPNGQEATTLFFHDHTLGATRLNLYAGLAAFYLIRDGFDTGLLGNPLGLPAGPYEIEIALQDRQFDTNGQWLFPDGFPAGLNGPPPNPTIHPFWNPEFFGDAIVVNGKTWPFFNIEPRRYRLRFVNGSNARFYDLSLGSKLPFWVIGVDGGLLDAPVEVKELLIAPGERADVIVDFAPAAGKTVTMENDAKAPFPKGAAADPQTVGRIMQFRVNLPLVGTDTSFNPAAGGALRGGAGQPLLIVRLANPATGTLAAGVTANKTRQLTLNEAMGMGGPLEVLLNNTKWGAPISEMPQVGSTEVWEIINLTADAHPIHLHLVQFQLMNRQAFNMAAYMKAYGAAFPGGVSPVDGMTYPAGVFIPGFGPPSAYTPAPPNTIYGGNPDVTPFLQGPVMPPAPEEAGWKDTVRMFPGEVTRIVVRWSPQDIAIGGISAGQNLYPFDPTTGPGYVWHCHIVDHEDNEMMRPYHPV